MGFMEGRSVEGVGQKFSDVSWINYITSPWAGALTSTLDSALPDVPA